MHTHFSLPLALLVLTFATASTRADGPTAPEVTRLFNLLKNGGFEEGGALPKVWKRFPAEDEGGSRQCRDTNTARTGKASVLIHSVASRPEGTPPKQWSQYGVPVEGGSTLIAVLHMKQEGAGPGHGGIHFYGEGKTHLGFVRIPIPASQDEWTSVRQSVDVPQGAKTMGFVAYARDNGKTWYDDLAALGTPETEAVRATPTIDGTLDEPCWAADRAITTWVSHTGTKVIAEPVRAWVAFDDTHLTVAFRCPRGTAQPEDSVEVFLDPNHNHKDYYHLRLDTRGTIEDAHGADTTWQSRAWAAVQHGKGEWSLELAIPYDPLGIGLDTDEVWGLNLAWNNRAKAETATWSFGGLHAPGRFGNVRIEPDLSPLLRVDLARRLEKLERERQRMLTDLQRPDSPVRTLKEPFEALDRAGDELDRLGRIADDAARRPDGGWDGVRQRLAQVSKAIPATRTQACAALFRIGRPGPKGSFRVAVAGSLQKVRRKAPVTDGPLTDRVRLDAARDEAESFQLVVMPNGEALRGVTVEAKPLEGPGGSIPLRWSRVAYVETAEPRYPTAYVGWWPDPLMPPSAFDVAADVRQPLWLTATVPPEAKAGHYAGEVTLRHGEHAVSVPVELRVRAFRLPRPGTLPAAFGLYRSSLGQWWYGKNHSKLPIETYVRWCEFMTRYRLTPKNIARDYVSHTKDDAGLHVDMSRLQQTVGALAAKYFPPYSFCMFRLPSSPQMGQTATARDPATAAAVVKVYAAEWKRQGLPAHAYIYGYDEPKPEHYPFLCEAYRRVHEAAPDYPIMQTLYNKNPAELVGFVDIWCPLLSCADEEFYAERRKAGDVLWTYVCCAPKPPYANFFVDRPATEHRVAFWQARQVGAVGFLYWCVCYWKGLPTAESGQPCFPDVPIRLKDHCMGARAKVNGDGILLYPGKDRTPLPGMRIEVIRDGIEDYEYLALLSRLVERAEALPADKGPTPDLLAEAKRLCLVPETISRTLTDYTDDPNAFLERRRQVADAIERMARALGEEAD